MEFIQEISCWRRDYRQHYLNLLKMENEENGKKESAPKQGETRKLWKSMEKSMPVAWVVIAVLLFMIATTWWRVTHVSP
jgi:hypothetical protein